MVKIKASVMVDEDDKKRLVDKSNLLNDYVKYYETNKGIRCNVKIRKKSYWIFTNSLVFIGYFLAGIH